MSFEIPLWRFAVSGTLIMLFGIADHLGRRAERDPLRRTSRPPRGFGLVIFASILGFYLTIEPFGRPLAGGWGNAAGIAAALGAAAFRMRAGSTALGLRMPDVAARLVFYAALPIAVGTLPGLLALTLPACATSVLWCRDEDRRLLAAHGDAWRERMSTTRRLLPGVW